MPAYRFFSLLAVLGIAAVLLGCGGEERPAAGEWTPKWEALLTVIPERDRLGSPPDEAVCRDTLASLRELSTEVFPTPSSNVTELVNEWVSVAEAAFFECPPQGEVITSFDEAYDELERIAESVETALANQE